MRGELTDEDKAEFLIWFKELSNYNGPQPLTREAANQIKRMMFQNRLRGMLAAHVTGVLTEKDRLVLLAFDDDTIRGWAVRLELEDKAASPKMLAKLAELAKSDPSPYVRLQLASGLQRLPLTDRRDIALRGHVLTQLFDPAQNR